MNEVTISKHVTKSGSEWRIITGGNGGTFKDEGKPTAQEALEMGRQMALR